MNFPDNLLYHGEHAWARLEGEGAVIGITDFAQNELGDLVFVEIPAVGAELKQGDIFGSVESAKSVSDLFSPVAGEVVESNTKLEDEPELINDDPYGEGWIAKVRLSDDFDRATLLSAAQYEKLTNS